MYISENKINQASITPKDWNAQKAILLQQLSQFKFDEIKLEINNEINHIRKIITLNKKNNDLVNEIKI